jgi:hypothetical protein
MNTEKKEGITLYVESEELRDETKNPDLEKSSEVIEVIESEPKLSALKQARAAKAEKKKAIKEMTKKFGNEKFAKKLVKTAVRNINTRRNAGRGR